MVAVMKRILLFLLFTILAGCVVAPVKPQQAVSTTAQPATPEAPPSLFGLGQFGLGTVIDDDMKTITVPIKTGLDEHGGTYRAFQVSQSGGYMVVLSAPFRPAYVYGIQISGGLDVVMTPVLGVSLGDSEDDLLEHVGIPTSKIKEADIDRTLWKYSGRNYSFETDSSGHLVSILIYGYEGTVTAMGWEPSWERYVPNSIAAVVEQDRAGWEGGDIYIAVGGVRFRPRVTYTGDVRNTSQATTQLLIEWMNTTPGNLSADRFSKSIRVIEDGKEYWLPTQSQVIKAMQENVKPGEAIDLFAIWVGAKDKGKTKAFLVNDYCHCFWVPRSQAN